MGYNTNNFYYILYYIKDSYKLYPISLPWGLNYQNPLLVDHHQHHHHRHMRNTCLGIWTVRRSSGQYFFPFNNGQINEKQEAF